MPSFVAHISCGHELLKKLKINEEDIIKFQIGNLVPDIKQTDIDYTLDEFINRNKIQKAKRITHFRKKTNKILEYPHCRIFLEKYEQEAKTHIETLAYFFHLYTDYYYFKYFLPETITFLDENMQEVDEIEHLQYVRIHKNGQVLKDKTFFSKIHQKGLYKEYTRSNQYLMNEFHLNLDTKPLREYLQKNSYTCYVEEIDLSKIYEVLDKIDRLNEQHPVESLQIFEEEKLKSLVHEVVETFIDTYKDIIKNYLK